MDSSTFKMTSLFTLGYVIWNPYAVVFIFGTQKENSEEHLHSYFPWDSS